MSKIKKESLFVVLFFFSLSYCVAIPPSFSHSTFVLTEKDIRPGQGNILKNDVREKILFFLRHFVSKQKSPCCHYQNPSSQERGDSFSYSERHTDNWSTLEKKLHLQGKESFHLIGFGSLLDPRSSRDFPTRKNPAIAFGVRRFFGFTPSSPERSSLGIPEAPYHHEQLRLSTRITKKESDLTNGVLLEIHLGKEMDALKKREKGYDLVKVPIIKITKNNRLSGEILYEIDEAYILAEPEKNALSRDIQTPKKPLSPHISYLYICLRGAQILSEQISKDTCFTQLFLETTFLEDGKTSLTEWIDISTQREDADF